MPKRVVVADDSLFMRKLITNLLQEDKELVVVGAAKNGEEAVRMVGELRPDVVTMDVEMPVMNGLEAVRRIMTTHPVPIVMLSSLTDSGTSATIDALHSGAIDFLQKPSGTVSADLFKVRQELVSKVKMAADTQVSRRISLPTKPTPVQMNPPCTPSHLHTQTSSGVLQVVAIGTSTGGPSALNQVIPYLQGDLPVAVFVVQHMPPMFTKSLASRLDSSSPMRVVEAEHNTIVRQGYVYVAPGDHHMVIVQSGSEMRIHLKDTPRRNGHRPSVDVMFESVANLNSVVRHYVIMTGMGNDGANGMKLGKQRGAASTIAESAETCVVYGMPKAAVELNCVDYELPLSSIANKLTRAIKEVGEMKNR